MSKTIRPQVSERLFKERPKTENTVVNKVQVTPVSKVKKSLGTPVHITPRSILKKGVTTPKELKSTTKESKKVELRTTNELQDYKNDLYKMLIDITSAFPEGTKSVTISDDCSLDELRSFKDCVIDLIRSQRTTSNESEPTVHPALSIENVTSIEIDRIPQTLSIENMTSISIERSQPTLSMNTTTPLEITRLRPVLSVDTSLIASESPSEPTLPLDSLEEEHERDVKEVTSTKVYDDIEKYANDVRMWNKILLFVIVMLIAAFFFVLE